jgi:methionyl-tRNA formyltransferase
MRIIYLGTPEFAVPTLEKLISWPEAEVLAVVTQPDRPAGRGNHVFAPPTKLVAQRHGIQVLQPEKLSKAKDVVETMRELKPDVLVMVAFGQILKTDVLTMAPLGVVNLHGSLLPKLRGAAPINWAIINGETVTGNTTMISDAGVDTGQMLLSQSVPIGPNTTAEELAHTMSIAGADLIIETLGQLKAGTLKPTTQDSSQATMAPRLNKEMGAIDWLRSANEIHNLVRGLYPWPGTFCHYHDAPLKVISTSPAVLAESGELFEPGTIVLAGNHVLVACGKDGRQALELLEVQPANKAKMKARDWVNGSRIKTGDRLKGA